MNFNIDNLGFKSYCRYSDKGLAKAYIVYSIQCERALNAQEWNILFHKALKLTLRKNRLYIARIWQQGNYIYFTGKQSHGCGYSWDNEVFNAFCPILGSFENQQLNSGGANHTPILFKIQTIITCNYSQSQQLEVKIVATQNSCNLQQFQFKIVAPQNSCILQQLVVTNSESAYITSQW